MTLVEDLKDAAECLLVPVPKDAAGYVYYAEAQLCREAANRIEALEKDNDLLRALLLGVEHCNNCTTCKSNAVQVRAALNGEGKP